jgi:antitoxin VapB
MQTVSRDQSLGDRVLGAVGVPKFSFAFYTSILNARISIRVTIMGLSIKNRETERLARLVAREAGESLTQAIERALRERLQRLEGRRQGRIMTEKLEDILRRVDALPTVDSRTADKILGYDQHGMPR